MLIISGDLAVNLLPVFAALMETEEDRTVAIVCGAHIEDSLHAAIAARLPGLNGKRREKLFSEKGVLNPVAARIEMARALNVTDGEETRLLTQVVRIRNRFAHNIDVDEFDHMVVAKLIDENMILGSGNQRNFIEAFSDHGKPATRREKFTYISLMLCLRLFGRSKSAV